MQLTRLLAFFILMISLLLPLAAAAQGSVPEAADVIAKELDRQIIERIPGGEQNRRNMTIAVTVPVSLGNLDASSPLARQMSEEISFRLIAAGYRVQEIRKGRDIVFRPETGELLLTRQVEQLASTSVTSVGILAGTYTVTRDSVRFNVRIIHTAGNEIMAMGTATVPVTRELQPLVADAQRASTAVVPSVGTRLP